MSELIDPRADGPATEPLIRADRLVKHFPVRSGPRGRAVRAVDDVTFEVRAGDSLGIVGESGSGKTTVTRMVLGLLKPTSGTMSIEGRDTASFRARDWHRFRTTAQAVFQDPSRSLSPRMRITDLVAEPADVLLALSKAERARRVSELLRQVGLPSDIASSLPHELSGGQRQRVAIARSLSVDPRLVVLDEPVSALDVSVRAQILNLLSDLRSTTGVSYLVISHDLGVVGYLATHVCVMYFGEIVEAGPAVEILQEPRHPYSRVLVAAGRPPNADEPERKAILLRGDVPSAFAPPSGCRFRTRCPHAFDRCVVESPTLRAVSSTRTVACHLFEEM